jgi:hypothetical protein
MPTSEYEPRPPQAFALLRAYDRAWRAWEADPGPRTFAVLQTGIEILSRELGKPGKFELGMVAMTPGAGEALLAAQHVPPEFLLRHKHGDWGELCAEDRREAKRAPSIRRVEQSKEICIQHLGNRRTPVPESRP